MRLSLAHPPPPALSRALLPPPRPRAADGGPRAVRVVRGGGVLTSPRAERGGVNAPPLPPMHRRTAIRLQSVCRILAASRSAIHDFTASVFSVGRRVGRARRVDRGLWLRRVRAGAGGGAL